MAHSQSDGWSEPLLGRLWPATIALLLFGVAIVAIGPHGEFPLNDDWDFAAVTWNLAETGQFEPTAYTAVSLRTQALLGAAWTHLFGRSYEALRGLTLTVFAVSILLLDLLLVQGGIRAPSRMVGLLAWMGHPIALAMAFSYMTHVYSITFAMAAIALLLAGWRRESATAMVLSGVMMFCALFIRQTNVYLFLLPFGCALVDRHSRSAAMALKLFSPTLLGALVLIFGSPFVNPPTGEFSGHAKSAQLVDLWGSAARMITAVPQHASLFFVSMMVGIACLLNAPTRRERIAFSLLVLGMLSRIGVIWGYQPPRWALWLWSDQLYGNYVFNAGIGVVNLPDVQRLLAGYPFEAPDVVRWLITLGTAPAGAILLLALVRILRERALQLNLRIVPVIILAAAVVHAAGRWYWDRYSLEISWPLILIGCAGLQRATQHARAVGMALAIVVASMSVVGVSEYMSWNRARGVLIERLLEQGVEPAQIDAGPEFRYSSSIIAEGQTLVRPAGGEEYWVTFHQLEGRKTVDRASFGSLLGLREGVLYTSRSAPDAAADDGLAGVNGD